MKFYKWLIATILVSSCTSPKEGLKDPKVVQNISTKLDKRILGIDFVYSNVEFSPDPEFGNYIKQSYIILDQAIEDSPLKQDLLIEFSERLVKKLNDNKVDLTKDHWSLSFRIVKEDEPAYKASKAALEVRVMMECALHLVILGPEATANFVKEAINRNSNLLNVIEIRYKDSKGDVRVVQTTAMFPSNKKANLDKAIEDTIAKLCDALRSS